MAIGHAGVVERQIVHAVLVLDVERQPFQPIGQLARDGLAIKAAHLLEIGELRHLHAVAPHFPAKPPGTQRRTFPVIFDETDVMPREIDADRRERAEIKLLQVWRTGFQDHLILVIMLQPVGVFAIAPVGRPPARLDEGGVPWLGPQRAQRGRGVKGARTHLHVIGLQDQAALVAPIIMERQNHALETERTVGQAEAFAVAKRRRRCFGASVLEGQCPWRAAVVRLLVTLRHHKDQMPKIRKRPFVLRRG